MNPFLPPPDGPWRPEQPQPGGTISGAFGASGPDDFAIVVPQRVGFWARITGAAAPPLYAFAEVQDVSTNTPYAHADVSGGMSGNAREVNNNIAVANGTVVWIWQSEANEQWVFIGPGAGGGGGGTGPDVTDGTHTVVAPTVIDFANAVLVSASGSTATVTLQNASTVTGGIVSTGGQSFAGTKTFTQGVVSIDAVVVQGVTGGSPTAPFIELVDGVSGSDATIQYRTDSSFGFVLEDTNLGALARTQLCNQFGSASDVMFNVTTLGVGAAAYAVKGNVGLTTTIGYNKSGGGTGTLTFTGGILTGST